MGSEVTAGQHIAERYRLIALRGTGGTASVWRAERLADGRECALKLLHCAGAESVQRVQQRFLREVRAASSIESPYVVRVFDHGLHGDVPFLAMELLEGETLAAVLRSAGRLSPLETCRIVGQIADALAAAHELGIVHRDLKPENVFLARGPHGTSAKVLDFGIAKLDDEPALAGDLTRTGALLGTPRYMSPEQIDGARHVDRGADLWALAVIAFECMTGRQPFRGEGLRELFAAICLRPAPRPSALAVVPKGFDAWFAKGVHRDAGKRFRSAQALAGALRAVCERELTAADTADEVLPFEVLATRPRARKTWSRGPRLIAVVAGGAIASLLWFAVHTLATPAAPAAASAPVRAAVARSAEPLSTMPMPAVVPTPEPVLASLPEPVAHDSAYPPPPPSALASTDRRSSAHTTRPARTAATGGTTAASSPPARRKKTVQPPAPEREDAPFDIDLLLRDRK